MFQSEVSIRVRYAETDRMEYVYYGRYAEYFEIARVETLRSLGITYRELEDSGILLPVLEYQVKFLKPVYYDEMITVKTVIPVLPAARIQFEYETFNNENVRVNIASTSLVFIRKETKKPCAAPESLLSRLRPYFS
ncbi:MAG: acyl-CoA thioesterase [Bacteroidia bacterium]|nr:acyl-CoA thioesterase [Bacteroidia bacterium]